MTCKEIKEEVKRKGIDRRKLAEKMGITPAYLNNLLNGWATLKGSHEKALMEAIGIK